MPSAWWMDKWHNTRHEKDPALLKASHAFRSNPLNGHFPVRDSDADSARENVVCGEMCSCQSNS